MCKVVVFALTLGIAVAFPAKDALMLDLAGDTAVVESTVRETRAVPERIEDLLEPGVKDAYLHQYGDAEGDDGDAQGYAKKTNDKGSDGYKHFDSYHKKDGDKYGFETHSEYGYDDGAKVDVGQKSGKYSDGEANEEDGEESRKSYQVVEEVNEKDKKKAVEDYDAGFYADSGDYAEGYTDGESAGYTDGAEGDEDSENYEVESEGYEDDGDGESGAYTAAEYDDAESEGYTAEDDDDY